MRREETETDVLTRLFSFGFVTGERRSDNLRDELVSISLLSGDVIMLVLLRSSSTSSRRGKEEARRSFCRFSREEKGESWLRVVRKWKRTKESNRRKRSGLKGSEEEANERNGNGKKNETTRREATCTTRSCGGRKARSCQFEILRAKEADKTE